MFSSEGPLQTDVMLDSVYKPVELVITREVMVPLATMYELEILELRLSCVQEQANA